MKKFYQSFTRKKMFIFVAMILALFLLNPFVLFGLSMPTYYVNGEGISVPNLPSEHPRLLLRNSDRSALQSKTLKLAALWKTINQNTLSTYTDSQILSKYNSGSFTLEKVRNSFESNALFYFMQIDPNTSQKLEEKNAATGRKAINTSLGLLQKMNSVDSYKSYDNSQVCGRTLLGAALVYDWCYELLTDDEKKNFISYSESLASKMELGYPPKTWGAVEGHSVGSPLMVDLLSVGVAVYDEKHDMYNSISSWVLNQVVPARNFWFRSDMDSQGDSYSTGTLENGMYCSWIFSKLGIKDVFTTDQQYLPYRWIYTRRPDGQLLRDGDSFICDQFRPGSYWKFPVPLILSSSYYKNPYVMDELKRQYETNIMEEPIFEFLFYDPDIPSKSIKNLPLTRIFDYPMGSMVARTGWDEGVNMNSSSVVAEMKVNLFQFNGHEHLDSGSFQLYYKGALAIDSGIYNGTNGEYGGLHDANYHKRTIAHNSILVYDPNEKFRLFGDVVGNDGGQRWPNSGNLPQTIDQVKNGDFNTGRVISYNFGPDSSKPEFSFLKGDLTNAYSSKVSKFLRSFVFLNFNDSKHPAALIVYDKVTSSNRDFKKYWLLHSIEEPSINKNVTTVARSESVYNTKTTPGVYVGKYNGKLINTTLIPAIDNLAINKVGGAANRFNVFGTNYSQDLLYPNKSQEPGTWRIEVSPKNSSYTDTFLNVMQVLDNKDANGNDTAALSTTKIDSNLMEGVKIFNRVVLFSKSGKKITDAVSLKVNGNELYINYILTDIMEGKWNLQKKGESKYTEFNITEGRNVIYFNGVPGEYVLTPVSLIKH